MFKSNHVGRPSNQELKTRKIKKAIVILLPVIIIFIGIIVISKDNLKSLMGNSVTTEYYCEDESYNLDGKVVTSWTSGDMHYTKTDTYKYYRTGSMNLIMVPFI